MRVQILGLDDNRNETKLGSITWNGRSFRCEPDTAFLQGILQERMYVEGKGNINAKDDPEAFLEGLQYHYKSAYLRATSPEGSGSSRGEKGLFPTLDTTSYQEMERAASETDTEPSEAAKKSGRYKKGKFKLHGFAIAIENPKGSVRSGKDKGGHEWSIRMKNHYGFIQRTESEADGDPVDVFLGDNLDSDKVFVVDQRNATTDKFDEHKVMLGFTNSEEAKAAYLSNYSPGWQGFAGMQEMSWDGFKSWLKEGTGEPATVPSSCPVCGGDIHQAKDGSGYVCSSSYCEWSQPLDSKQKNICTQNGECYTTDELAQKFADQIRYGVMKDSKNLNPPELQGGLSQPSIPPKPEVPKKVEPVKQSVSTTSPPKQEQALTNQAQNNTPEKSESLKRPVPVSNTTLKPVNESRNDFAGADNLIPNNSREEDPISKTQKKRNRLVKKEPEQTDESSQPGESSAESKNVGDRAYHLETRKIIQRFFGSDLSDKDFEKLAGGVQGSKVIVKDRRGGLVVTTNGRDFNSEFSLHKGPNGLECYYGRIVADFNARGSSLVPKVLSSQLRSMKEKGVTKILTSAAGFGPGATGKTNSWDMIGYKVWPKMGFDGKLLSYHKDKLSPQYRSANTIQELYAMPGGRKEWEQNGSSIDLSLDLNSPQADKAIALMEKMANSQVFNKDLPIQNSSGLTAEEQEIAKQLSSGLLYPPNRSDSLHNMKRQKAMSFIGETSGGALMSPAKQKSIAELRTKYQKSTPETSVNHAFGPAIPGVGRYKEIPKKEKYFSWYRTKELTAPAVQGGLSTPAHSLEGQPCGPGQTASATGCVPSSGGAGGGQKESTEEAGKPENQLMVKAAAGDKGAFEKLTKLFFPKLVTALEKRFGDRAQCQDAANETMLKIYQNLDKFDPNKSFPAWAYNIASRTMIDERRKQDRKKRMGTRALGGVMAEEKEGRRELGTDKATRPGMLSQGQHTQELENLEQLHQAVEKLPESDKKIVQARMQGRTLDDIGKELGVSLVTVHNRYKRALESLKETFQQKGLGNWLMKTLGGFFTKDLQILNQKGGFTGTRQDSKNRVNCFQNGKKVACGRGDSGTPTQSTGKQQSGHVLVEDTEKALQAGGNLLLRLGEKGMLWAEKVQAITLKQLRLLQQKLPHTALTVGMKPLEDWAFKLVIAQFDPLKNETHVSVSLAGKIAIAVIAKTIVTFRKQNQKNMENMSPEEEAQVVKANMEAMKELSKLIGGNTPILTQEEILEKLRAG